MEDEPEDGAGHDMSFFPLIKCPAIFHVNTSAWSQLPREEESTVFTHSLGLRGGDHTISRWHRGQVTLQVSMDDPNRFPPADNQHDRAELGMV